jgi:hypothetical protein
MGGRNAEWNEHLTKTGPVSFLLCGRPDIGVRGCWMQQPKVTRFDLKNGRIFNGFLSNCWWVGESTNNLKRIPTAKMDLFLSNFRHWRNIHDGCYHVLDFSLDSFPFHRSNTQQTLTTWPFRWEALLSAFTFSWLPQDDRAVHNHLAMMTSTLLSLSRPEPLLSLISLFFFSLRRNSRIPPLL